MKIDVSETVRLSPTWIGREKCEKGFLARRGEEKIQSRSLLSQIDFFYCGKAKINPWL